MKKFGIDISEYNGIIDFETLKHEVDFVIIRVGYGDMLNGGEDAFFKRNVKGCIDNNIPYGFYMANYPWNDERAVVEANAMLKLIAPYKPTYPIYYDFEGFSVDYAKNTHGITVTKEMASRWATIWCDILEKEGYYVGVYANPDYIKNYFNESVFEKYDLWLAHWVTTPYIQANLWQTGSNGVLNGAKDGIARVDTNYAFIDYPSLIKSKGLNGHSKTNIKEAEKEKPKKTISQLADEVQKGLWGNDPDRSASLRKAGYDAVAVQDEVNRRLYGSISVGDKVDYTGYVYADSYGGGQGQYVSGVYPVTIVNNNPYGIHIGLLGWVKKTSVRRV